MNEAKAAEYQKRADECRAAAARTKGRESKRMLLGMADHWQLLADSAKRHAKRSAEERPAGEEEE